MARLQHNGTETNLLRLPAWDNAGDFDFANEPRSKRMASHQQDENAAGVDCRADVAFPVVADLQGVVVPDRHGAETDDRSEMSAHVVELSPVLMAVTDEDNRLCRGVRHPGALCNSCESALRVRQVKMKSQNWFRHSAEALTAARCMPCVKIRCSKAGYSITSLALACSVS